MKKTAFLFPGQGSQKVGMGADIYEAFDTVRNLFAKAARITGLDIIHLCFEGPMKDLTATINLQPAVTTVNLAFLSVLNQRGRACDFAAGHSLGEYSALCAAGVISESDAIRLVFKRGELMHRESEKNKGSMAAIVGMPIESVRDLIQQAGAERSVSVANHNTETQIVITGSPDPVKKVISLAKEMKARAMPLKVSGAWHSRLIKGAEEEFEAFIESVTFSAPKIPVYHNLTAKPSESNPDSIKKAMVSQLCSPVKWYDTIRHLVEEEVDVFVEIGPGNVLTGLLKKILPADYPAEIFNINSVDALNTYLSKSA